MGDEKTLKEQLEVAKSENLNLRFDKVERELTDIKTLLKDYIVETKTNREEYLKGQNLLEKRINTLEEVKRNCPINSLKSEVHRFSKETSFIREMFKNPWKGGILLTIWIIIITTLVLVFGPSAVFELLLKMKGM